MPFVAGAVLWAGYTVGFWGWMAMTDRVPQGAPNTFHWPSFLDLVKPGQLTAVDTVLGKKNNLNQVLSGLVPTSGQVPAGGTAKPGALPDTGNILNAAS